MNKNELRQLLSQGKTHRVVESLESIKNQLDDDLQNEIILQAGRFRSFSKEKISGGLTNEQEGVQLARVNNALLDIINRLPNEEFNGLTLDKKNFVKWGAILVSVIMFGAALAEFTGYSLRDIWSNKQETPIIKRDTTVKKDSITQSSIVKEEAIKNIPQPTAKKQPPSDNLHQGGSTNFKGNTTVNGQIITNPSAPITIENNFTIKKDSIR